MELDELKSAWQQLGQQLERQSALAFAGLKLQHFARLRASLRPLYVGQWLQLGLGILTIAFATLAYRSDLPLGVIAAGVVLHVYGIVCIAGAGTMLTRLRRLDPSGPVVGMQQQLARLRTAYVVSGLAAGLPWWLLWVPVLMVLAAQAGVDLYAHAPEFVWGSIAIGIAGIAASFGFYRWTRDPRRARLGQALDAQLAGGSLRRAQRWLDEIAAFAKD